MKRIINRGTDLNKIALVNNISREIHDGKLTIEEAYEQLARIRCDNLSYPLWFQVLAAAVTSSCFVIMFRGSWEDFLPGFLTGGIAYFCFLIVDRIVHVRFSRNLRQPS